MRWLIAGVGGVGGYYGARLAASGQPVVFMARGEQLRAIRENGLRILSPSGDMHLADPVAVDSAADQGAFDAILVAVKTYDNESVAAAIAPGVRPGTVICSLQNGIDNEEFFTRRLPGAVVLGVTTVVEAFIERPGVISQPSRHQACTIGALDPGAVAVAAAVGASLASAGVPVEVSDDILGALWWKFAGICGVGGTTAFADADLGVVRADPDLRELLGAVVAEVAAVAAARGVQLAADLRDTIMNTVDHVFAADFTSSMCRDRRRGRPLEVDSLNGRVVALGEEMGLACPANRRITEVLRPIHLAALAARETQHVVAGDDPTN